MAKKAAKEKAAKKDEKKKRPTRSGTDEQLELIDTTPDNVKPFIKKARQYRETILDRLAIQQQEAEQKAELRELVAASGLTPDDKGNISFTHEGVTITVAPMQEGKLTVQVNEDS